MTGNDDSPSAGFSAPSDGRTPPAASGQEPLFGLLGAQSRHVKVVLDGKAVTARKTDTVASLLLRLLPAPAYRRSAISGAVRAPLCMMGVCFECLVEIDGQPNEQGCLVRVRDGMQIRRQVRKEAAE